MISKLIFQPAICQHHKRLQSIVMPKKLSVLAHNLKGIIYLLINIYEQGNKVY
jgi:hypothetical protein